MNRCWYRCWCCSSQNGLRSRYGFSRTALLDIFPSLLQARKLSFGDEPAFERALFRWKDSSCQFSDCLIAARNRHSLFHLQSERAAHWRSRAVYGVAVRFLRRLAQISLTLVPLKRICSTLQ